MAERIRFARRVSVRARPERVDEFLSIMRDQVLPGLSRENGIRRIYLLRDRMNPNQFISLTLWDSSGDAEAYESSGHYSANTGRVRECLEEDPVASQYEVEYHTVSPALPPPVARRKRTTRTRRAKKARRPAKRRRR